MAQEVLTVLVDITGVTRVEGARGSCQMVAFTGTVDCPNFRGRILPGGVDTQKMTAGHLSLSARYILEGTDGTGHAGHIFIENNGETDDPAAPMTTHQHLCTDCPSLQWLETADLYGTLEPRGTDGVCIHIFAR